MSAGPPSEASAPPAGLRRHAGCVAWMGRGVLLEGPSGAGKSTLALRLVEAGFDLVADDLVELRPGRAGELVAKAAALPGHLEIRGLGIVRLPFASRATLALAVRLGGPSPERLPKPATLDLLGRSLPLLDLDARAPDAVARVRLALLLAGGGVVAP